MHRTSALWLIALVVLAAACTPGEIPESPFAGETIPTAPPPAPTTSSTEPLIVDMGSVLAVADQVYLRSLHYDVHIPTITPDAPSPVAVLLHASGAGGRATMRPLAESLAGEGIIVYNVDMEVPGFGGRHPEPFSAASCATAIASRDAASHGGDPSNITVIGHSFGGMVASVIGQVPDLFLTDCDATEVAPFRVVGIAGTYDLDNLESVAADALIAYFDGTRAVAPGSWETADPHSYLANGNQLNMLIITATADGEVPKSIAGDWATSARENDHQISGPIVIEGTHRSVLANADLVLTLVDFLTNPDN